MPTRRLRLPALLAGAFALAALGGVAPSAQQAPALQPATLAGLRFRTIGPATMSGRIVDIAVVDLVSPGKQTPDQVMELIRPLMWTIIWVIYVHQSPRVAATFVERAPWRKPRRVRKVSDP